jgi:hypothetical protein
MLPIVPKYRANLTRRAIRGALHSSVEVQLYHYAYGCPKVSFEVEPPGVTTTLSARTPHSAINLRASAFRGSPSDQPCQK